MVVTVNHTISRLGIPRASQISGRLVLEVALSLLTTVVSRPSPEIVTVDASAKKLTSEERMPVPKDPLGLTLKAGFVTLPKEEREEPGAAIFSGGRDRRPPRVHRRRTEGAVRSGGCQVALNVEGVVDGRVSRKKSLG